MMLTVFSARPHPKHFCMSDYSVRTGGCTGLNEIGKFAYSLSECQAACTSNGACVSFEFRKEKKEGTSSCQMSSNCTASLAAKNNKLSSSFWLYVKNSFEMTPKFRLQVPSQLSQSAAARASSLYGKTRAIRNE